MSTDEARITDLHEQFIVANTREDTAWLGAHVAPDVSWFNLNKSNYFGDRAIIDLWKWLYEQRPDKNRDATLTVADRVVTVTAEAAWVVYNLSIDYDFGEAAQFHAGGRATEIWTRVGDDFKLAHFHCSEHEVGNMGGL